MFFAAIFAAGVAGVAAAGAGSADVDNFVKIRLTDGKELLKMCVTAANEAFAERQPQLFSEATPKEFIKAVGVQEFGFTTTQLYSQCLRFFQERRDKVPVANRGAFDARYKKILEFTANTNQIYWKSMPPKTEKEDEYLSWESLPTLKDIANPTKAVYKRVLNPRVTAKMMKAILVLAATSEVSKKGDFETPLADSIIAISEFLSGGKAPLSPVEDNFSARGGTAGFTYTNCIYAVKSAIEEATGIDKTQIDNFVKEYDNQHSVEETADQTDFVENMFNNCFNLSNALYDSGKFSEDQKTKISQLQAKLITSTHPNMNLWKEIPSGSDIRQATDFTSFIEDGTTVRMMKAKISLQAARAVTSTTLVGNRLVDPNPVVGKLLSKITFLNKMSAQLRR